jgi:hypothetical protein
VGKTLPANDQLRVTDTVNYLQNTTLVAVAVRNNAAQLVQNYINAAFANPALPAYHQFSQTMSLGAHLLSDPNEHRRMTRVVFLLWQAMRHYDGGFTLPKQTIGAISQGTVRRLLTSYLYKACALYENLNGGNQGVTQALAAFQANPLQFLDDNKVFVSGSGFLDAGQAPQNVLASKLSYNPHHDRYEFSVRYPVTNGAAIVQVESVTAFHWTDQRYVPRPMGAPPLVLANTNFNQMTGIELSGVHPMVTTQFTGCAFSMAEHGGSMYCAHVSPAGVPNMAPNTDGPTLARRILASNGAFANAGGTQVRVYGRRVASPAIGKGYDLGAGGGGATTYMTIVAFPGGASYQIYAQTTVNSQIVKVKQIY